MFRTIYLNASDDHATAENVNATGSEIRVTIEPDYPSLSSKAAAIVAEAIRRKPRLSLGLASGATPLGMYRRLVRLHRDRALDFSGIRAFNLDEYLGLPPSDPESFHSYLWRHLLRHLNIRSKNMRLLSGVVRGSRTAYCERYEQTIREAAGIDLQILGIGYNGHIAFNQPGSSLKSRTRVVRLVQGTPSRGRHRSSGPKPRPKYGITMGIGTILEARTILMIASGALKAEAVAKAVGGPVARSVPASALQLHPDVTIVLDRAAARELSRRTGGSSGRQ